jgi:hypothetical protein
LQDDGVWLVTRIALVGDRLYRVIVSARTDTQNAPDTRKFIDSFAITLK